MEGRERSNFMVMAHCQLSESQSCHCSVFMAATRLSTVVKVRDNSGSTFEQAFKRWLILNSLREEVVHHQA